MHDIALRRLRVLALPRGAGLGARDRLVVLSELAGLGFTVPDRGPLEATDPAWLARWPAIAASLRALRGGDVAYVPLFSGFPDEVPDDDERFARRLMGYLGNALRLFPEGQRLESGVVVPEWLFDLRRFGADPITQLQDPALFERARAEGAARPGDSHVEWWPLRLVFEDELPGLLRSWLVDTLCARSSIKQALHDDIRALLTGLGAAGLDPERVVVKENRALLTRALWEAGDRDGVAAFARTPTDLLRLFAALTDGDVSLATPIRFPKFSRPQRRLLLSVLEAAPALAEDLRRYRGLWLEIGRYLHPGEYAAAFPRVAAAFADLRAGRVITFDARVEALISAGDVGALLAHLGARPGALARRLHELLRRLPSDTEALLAALRAAAPRVAVKNLLVMRAYFASINDLEERAVINKLGKVVVLPNATRGALRADTLAAIDALLRDALRAQLARRPRWDGRAVWIDPALSDYAVPLQQRAASDGALTYGRGTRLPVDLDRALRLFVYWRQAARDTDLDLSVIQFDADWGYLGHVSYTALSDQGIVHSGDLLNAPLGAAEFIDITLSALLEAVAYLAVEIYRYEGERFSECADCRAGWMVRDRVDADYQSFDVKTVANCFALTGGLAYALPLLVDLRGRAVVWMDLYMAGRALHNNVEGSHHNVARASRAIAGFTRTRPTMLNLALAHADARGGRLVEAREEAEITFGVEGCTFDAGDVTTILSELL